MLPVEFIEVMESVPVVDLSGNPWSDLSALWPPRSVTTVGKDDVSSFGYDAPSMLEFLYLLRILGPVVEREWDEGRRSLEEFSAAVRARLGSAWKDAFLSLVNRIYFKV